MTLGEMVDYVCAKVQQTDSEAKARCKDFIAKRYEMIWYDQLWRDCIVMSNVSIDPDNSTLHAAGIVLMPQIIEEVIGLRSSDNRSLRVQRAESYYGVSYDYFTNTGTPAEYIQMSPVVHQFATATNVTFTAAVAGDNGTPLKVLVRTGSDVMQSYDLVVNGTYDSISSVLEVESLSKPVTSSYIYIKSDDLLTTYSSISAFDKNATRYARVRLVEKPDDDFTLRVLGRRRFIPLSDDSDAPIWPKCSNAVIAFAQADMYEYQRQRASAQAKGAEGIALLNQLTRTEIFQRADNARLVPEEHDSALAWSFGDKGYFN